MKIAIQMDAIESIRVQTDSTYLLGLEAQKRRYSLFYYQPKDLSFREGTVRARGNFLHLKEDPKDYFGLGDSAHIDLKEMDVVLMRNDPPFDMAYITATHLLEHLAPDTLVVNDPFHVRNAPEKLFMHQFPEFVPPTLISSDREEIMAFRKEHGDIVIKPLYGYAGISVFHLKPEDSNLDALLETLRALSKEPVIAQKYIPGVKEMDKRIILIDGEIGGAVGRVPASGEIRANFRVGGTAAKTELTAREREICAALGPELKKRGLVFVGLDVIDGWLTEINVTSPTAIPAINRLNGVKLEAQIWDAIEARI